MNLKYQYYQPLKDFLLKRFGLKEWFRFHTRNEQFSVERENGHLFVEHYKFRMSLEMKQTKIVSSPTSFLLQFIGFDNQLNLRKTV